MLGYKFHEISNRHLIGTIVGCRTRLASEKKKKEKSQKYSKRRLFLSKILPFLICRVVSCLPGRFVLIFTFFFSLNSWALGVRVTTAFLDSLTTCLIFTTPSPPPSPVKTKPYLIFICIPLPSFPFFALCRVFLPLSVRSKFKPHIFYNYSLFFIQMLKVLLLFQAIIFFEL